jgi:hypothetical protein
MKLSTKNFKHVIGAIATTAMAMTALGCSYGTVTDKETKGSIPGAYVMFKAPDFSKPYAGNPIVKSADYQNVYAWNPASPGSNGASGLWYLNPWGKLNAGDTKTTYVPQGWERIYSTAPGYDPHVSFRNHLYTDCSVYGDKNPYSNAAYPYDPSGPTKSALCASETVSLSRSNVDYVKDPDIIVDPRSLLDYAISETRGPVLPDGTLVSNGDCEGKYNRCVRVSIGTPNVGVGDLYVTSPPGQPGPVTQHRFRRLSGTKQDDIIDGSFVHDGHPHLHFLNWTSIRLRQITAACNTEAKATACPILPSTGGKRSFCLEDFAPHFDDSPVAGVYQPNKSYTCSDQGIASGSEDIYLKHLAGQMVNAEGLHGDFWLEVEVNPTNPATGKRAVIESDYTNNVARVKITIP